jgi:hypothetical protein
MEYHAFEILEVTEAEIGAGGGGANIAPPRTEISKPEAGDKTPERVVCLGDNGFDAREDLLLQFNTSRVTGDNTLERVVCLGDNGFDLREDLQFDFDTLALYSCTGTGYAMSVSSTVTDCPVDRTHSRDTAKSGIGIPPPPRADNAFFLAGLPLVLLLLCRLFFLGRTFCGLGGTFFCGLVSFFTFFDGVLLLVLELAAAASASFDLSTTHPMTT